MPKIRSITFFTEMELSRAREIVQEAGAFLEAAKQAFEAAGQTVQTCRVATQAFPQWISPAELAQLPQIVASIFEVARQNGVDYLSIGPASASDSTNYIDVIPDLFAAVPGVFASVDIANQAQGISLPLVARVAKIIKKISHITSDGMTNLYLAALASCPAGSPFFPVAYHAGGAPHFALAIQAADIAVSAFKEGESPVDARNRLQTAIQQTAGTLLPVADELASTHEIDFSGLDFSLAPYPTADESLGGAMESLGPVFGGAGLVASASLVMNAIEAANFPSTGFSGLMLPILEDTVLAERTAAGQLTLNDLLLLSAVCGTGLDCIPLPGEVDEQVLAGILLDVASLALRLDKPLTARLMPFPGKKPGDSLEFDFEYFANSRVLAAPRAGITSGVLFSSEASSQFNIVARRQK
jgi:hypothetical protein